jgi:hypothetical protein
MVMLGVDREYLIVGGADRVEWYLREEAGNRWAIRISVKDVAAERGQYR